MRRSVSIGSVLALSLALAGPAAADHTDPRQPIIPAGGAFPGAPFQAQGAGTWQFIENFPTPAGTALTGSGTDHKFFVKGGDLYASVGSLGQGNEGVVGQRIFRLTQNGQIDPTWVADHGSAACTPANQSITGLQHDQAVLGTITKSGKASLDSLPARSLAVRPEVLLDTTDASGRCHDPGGGGLELIDITRLEDPAFEPREIHLIRHAGFSHTVTVDDTRPWIIYNSTSDFAGRPWIDVVDARTCLGLGNNSLAGKRALCRPKVYRIPFQPDWSRQRNPEGELVPGSEAACHDITSRGSRLYCATPNATLIFDVSDITRKRGAVRGTPLTCPVIPGTGTTAAVTNCDSAFVPPVPQLARWKFLGTFNHPGRSDGTGGTQGNTNVEVPSDEGVSVAHEADPSPNHRWLFVTDERGGGVVPPGASCAPGIDNPIGNGGISVFDIGNPAKIQYAKTAGGEKAIWISDAQIPAPSFCTVHVIERLPGEQRFSVAYYTQGTKILDYFIDNGRLSFQETASLILPNANTWAATAFKITKNPDGTVTYFFLASDINRGVDVLSWTGPGHAQVAAERVSAAGVVGAGDVGLALLALIGLPAAARYGRVRRRSRKAR